MGAWIEIKVLHITINSISVAPRVGAWIEIIVFYQYKMDFPVAPRVGAWIEMGLPVEDGNTPESLPVWGRGLKFPP